MVDTHLRMNLVHPKLAAQAALHNFEAWAWAVSQREALDTANARLGSAGFRLQAEAVTSLKFPAREE